MKEHNDNIKSLMDKIKTLEELTGDRNIKDHKKIEELINKYLSHNIKSYQSRIMNPIEKKILTQEAFTYLLDLVKDNLLSYNEFEKVINQLSLYS
nr:hypothetical protein [Candidatus Cloacimonadota bacterium]